MTTFTDERRLTYAEAKAELLRISVSRGEGYVYPDWKYGSCKYRWTSDDVKRGRCAPDEVGQGACLLGQAMAEWDLLDYLVPPFDDDDDEPDFRNNYDAIKTVISPEDVPTTGRDWPWVEALMTMTQQNQDLGMAWPLAVRNAIATVEAYINAGPEDERPEGWAPHQWSQ